PSYSIMYVPGGYYLPYVECHTYNLHIFSREEPQKWNFYGKKTDEIRYVTLLHDEHEAFYPWMLSPYSLSIHSPVVPESPLSSGKALTLGKQYKVSIRLEEEHLLPHPYATKCTDYDTLWRQNDKTGPRSQQVSSLTLLLNETFMYLILSIS
ncbi:uncharacterized protein CDAR_523301, partial [Caerostris darwini]